MIGHMSAGRGRWIMGWASTCHEGPVISDRASGEGLGQTQTALGGWLGGQRSMC